jgi:hypothetical protein
MTNETVIVDVWRKNATGIDTEKLGQADGGVV